MLGNKDSGIAGKKRSLLKKASKIVMFWYHMNFKGLILLWWFERYISKVDCATINDEEARAANGEYPESKGRK
jgi:hypothetical protein